MNTLFVIVGQTGSGKNYILNNFKESEIYKNNFKELIRYTDRPMRENEEEGSPYHFIDTKTYKDMVQEDRFIETESFTTANGEIWSYGTCPEDINLDESSYITQGSLDVYLCYKECFGEDNVVPIYVDSPPQLRLRRALNRDENSIYEVCRRVYQDSIDYAQGRIKDNIPEENIIYNNEDGYENIQGIFEDLISKYLNKEEE